MQYLPNSSSPWITYQELIPEIMSAENFRQMKVRGKIRVSCTGGNGRQILIEYNTLPTKPTNYKALVEAKYGKPQEYISMEPLKALAVEDGAVRQYYADYTLPTTGEHLPLEYQLKYVRQCYWLGAIDKALVNKKSTKDILGISIDKLWENFSVLINADTEGHELPTSVSRLKRRYRVYRDKGMTGLIEAWRFGNDYARKVSEKIEGLILSLFCQPHKPYMNEVCMEFRKFMRGERQIVDTLTGEVYNPMDFYVNVAKAKSKSKKVEGEQLRLTEPYMLGESTVDYYVKKPGNEVVINKYRLKAQEYDSKYRPSVKRIGAFYALAKISMDDIDLPFQGPNGDRVVKSYQVYDCASEAIIGVSFSEDKNMELIMEALRDMFRLIVRNGWGVPWEIEMERHLTSAMKGKVDKETGEWYDDIFTPGAVFPATRICQRAQEKRAEGFIKKKKYGFQKKREGFQGRFYSRLLTNRLNQDQKPLRQLYEEIVQHEIDDIYAFNHELHPKQELYPNMTRWQVLEQTQHPQLPKYQPQQVIQFIGYSTATSIRAGVARVQYGDYMLPDITLIKETTYNGEITAYYLPDEDGMVNSVYPFEDGKFLCEAMKKMGFHEAVIEQTAEDKVIMQEQWAQQKSFDKMVKDGKAAIVPVAMTNKLVEKKKTKIVKALPAPVQEQPYILDMDAKTRAMMDI